ncbi:WG repeat-containing protein [Hymenobacter rubidus]|uniref:WG repeat-containing protein n=1 Tax=Hymenobacter rubidus TaxID=1441626 RepID=UPI0019202C2D|nr:WG repeat-containing protein [Hymenobacter rubidus]
MRTALQAHGGADALLLGNLVLEDEAAPLDALVVRPHSITLLVLVPGSGHLNIPALSYGSWTLDGAPLPGPAEFDNPFEQFQQQKAAVAAWLQPRFSPEQADLAAISGVVQFAEPVVLGSNVGPALEAAPATFRLLPEPAQLGRCLDDLASSAINLSPAAIAEWAAEWEDFLKKAEEKESASTAAPTAAVYSDAATAAGSFLSQKARAIWGWLGAHDVPDDDPPYGYDRAAVAARSEEKEHLEQLRQQMQADLNAQMQALAAREAERERSIAQLRAELAQAPPVAAEATALVSRLGAETREKAALEAEMQASRAESEARNRELDAKIQQLSQLIEQLSTQPTGERGSWNPVPPASAPERPAPAAEPVAASSAPSSQRPAAAVPLAERVGSRLQGAGASLGMRFQQLRRWRRRFTRVGLVAGVAAGVAVLALGGWGLSRMGGSAPVPFQENGRWGYADASGQPVVPAQFTAAGPFQDGRAVVAQGGAYGFVDEKGKPLLPPTYDALNPYAGGYARVRVGEAYTFIDEDGQEFDHYYFNALDFAEGHAAVLDHRGWHYISGPDEPEKPPIFAEAYSFAEGLARVKLPDGYTYITADYLDDPSRGTKPFGRYQQAADFAGGKARVTQAGRSFVIDKDGEEIK